jgi:pre-mRNA-splicing factor CWC22
VISELDLVEESDKITHNLSIDDQLELEQECNTFKFDPEFTKTEQEWEEIKKEILGDYKLPEQQQQEQEPEIEDIQESVN